MTWTDDGGPKSTPPYQGAPAAVNNNVGKGHCIGCHAISNDGKYMALTIGGSASDAANTTILDIGAQSLININPAASTDPNSSPTVNFSDYWKKFRVEGVAAENTWGPNNDRMISMFRSKLYQTNVTISGTTGTVMRAGAVVPSWTEYASDPFWSPDGSLFVFTSFDQPDIGMYNTDGSERRHEAAREDRDRQRRHDGRARRRARSRAAHGQRHQLLSEHQQRQQAGGVQPEHVWHRSGREPIGHRHAVRKSEL